MSNINQFKLSRTIPEIVKRKVRKNSGFGCVICGSAICQYEHINPEFKDAKSHNPKGITLLCAKCHDNKTRGIYSKESVLEHMKNPKCKEKGFTRDDLEIGTKNITVQLGKCLFVNVLSLFCIDRVSILTLIPPELFGEPYKLNAFLTDNDENGIFGIENNFWYGNIENWDIECIGNQIKIRKKLGEIALHIENIPREKLIIHRLNMSYKGYNIFADNSIIRITSPTNEVILELIDEVKITGRIPFIIENGIVHLQKLKIEGGNLHLIKGVADHCFIENFRTGQFAIGSYCTIGNLSMG